MFYFIAGASLSGKTSIRLSLQKKYGMSGLDTDTLRTIAEKMLSILDAGHNKSPQHNYINLKPLIDTFLYARGFFPNERFILEGDAINFGSINQLTQPSKTVVLGYPHANVETIKERLINTRSPEHWSHNLRNDELETKIKEFIGFSSFLESRARENNFDFIDVENLSLGELQDTIEHRFNL